MIRVLMSVEGFGSARFGVEKVVNNISTYITHHGVSCDVVTMVIDGELNSTIKSHVYQVPYWCFTKPLRFHPAQYSQMRTTMDKLLPRIVHCHGCLSWLQVTSIWSARKQSDTIILLSPHGMLQSWMWMQKGAGKFLFKKLFWAIFLKPIIKQADFFHAITPQEAETLSREFPGVPQIRIPNAIDLNEYGPNQITPKSDKYFLFLGRLHPVKGVDVLIKAFAQAGLNECRLIIAGPDFDSDYSASLKKLVTDLSLNNVSFIGPVEGERKEKLLRESWCVVVPSYSEVIAMVNLESSASFTPTITTRATGLSDWEEGGGMLIDPDVNQLSTALSESAKWTVRARMERGRKSRELVEQRYCWGVIGKQWLKAYRMVAEAGKI